MSCLAIQGMQWGDEGKGKITDYFACQSDVVVRSQGGNNAGHSIVRDGKRFALRLVPSGIFSKGVVNILANGTVINPEALLTELEGLESQGIKDYTLLVSSKATILMPYHIELDKAKEAALAGGKIGTTGRGIGPCYSDKASRLSLRMGDLLEEDYLFERLKTILTLKNIELASFGLKTYTVKEAYDWLMKAKQGLSTRIKITDTSAYLCQAIAEKKKILFEGAQGAMLCLDHGTFPYVTSSSPLASAIPLNCGIPCSSLERIIGITKAYTTRVGEGPFPTEIEGELAQTIRDKGHEYGTVTKRPRRIGWIDAVQLKYVISLTGVKDLALMLLDVLGGLDEIRIGVSYELDGKKTDLIPSCLAAYQRCKPVFISMPSWKEDISTCREYAELPEACKNYISKIEELTGADISLVSVGPDEKQTIIRKKLI